MIIAPTPLRSHFPIRYYDRTPKKDSVALFYASRPCASAMILLCSKSGTAS